MAKVTSVTDETSFEMGEQRRQWVSRPYSQEYNSRYLQATFRSGRQTLPVWGAIAFNKKWHLVFLDLEGKKGVSAKVYSEQVLYSVLDRMGGQLTDLGREMYVVEDGARSHTAKVAQESRDLSGITSLFHPAQSPDLNPIEDMWLDLKTKVTSFRPVPTNLQMLREQAERAWEEIPIDKVDRLVEGMEGRRQAIVKVRGKYTPL